MKLIYDQMEFFNVTSLKQIEGFPGYKMVRFPDDVREEVCVDVADMTRGVEIRFYVEKESGSKHGGRIYLTARDYEGEALLYWGDYQAAGIPIRIPMGVITTIPVEFPIGLENAPEGRFPNRLCRIVMNNRSSIQYIGKENLNVRPPKEGEEPAKVIVGYGSSITHGGASRSENYSYIPLTARMMKMDSLNLGFSGSCFAEKAMGDFMAEKTDAAVYFMEFGTNMNHPIEEFYKRVSYVINRVTKAHPEALVLVTGPYPDALAPVSELRMAYAQAVEEIAKQAEHPNIHYVPAKELLSDLTAVVSDGVHPSPYGHMLIANRLAELIRQYS